MRNPRKQALLVGVFVVIMLVILASTSQAVEMFSPIQQQTNEATATAPVRNVVEQSPSEEMRLMRQLAREREIQKAKQKAKQEKQKARQRKLAQQRAARLAAKRAQVRTRRATVRVSSRQYSGSGASIIRQVGRQNGCSSSDIQMLLSIAMKESSLRCNAVSATGKYVGLFQLGPHLGSYEQRLDPYWNTARAIKYMRGRYGSIAGAYNFRAGHGWY